MLRYPIVYLAISLISGILGFGGVAESASGIAIWFFFLFLALFVICTLSRLKR
ncbi:DUF1328 domain-containing protein [Changchengzhania lutea]|uniref:DUF1328 domain-containing protein n=1 Tax=Changchengzhania lutea TaxID=2049305 RepID=UPI00115E243C|nr:DUF1328 family protein [Changchengzhania lutea]